MKKQLEIVTNMLKKKFNSINNQSNFIDDNISVQESVYKRPSMGELEKYIQDEKYKIIHGSENSTYWNSQRT